MDMSRVANSLRHILASSYKGGCGQNDIFFQFFCTQKTQKNSTYIQPTQVVFKSLPHVETSVQKVAKVGTSNVRFWGVQNRTFWQVSGKVRKVAEIRKSWQISKNQRNPEKSQKSAKSWKIAIFPKNRDFSDFWQVWLGPYVSGSDLPESRFWQVWQVWQVCPESCPEPKKSTFFRSGKIAKISDFFEFWTPQKSRKKVLYAVEIDDRKWRHRAICGGQKNALFRGFSRVKEKNVLFSG